MNILFIQQRVINFFRWIKKLFDIELAIDTLYGYDIYIVHRRSDSEVYAGKIYDALKNEISCFIDKKEFLPGDSLALATKRHITRSTALIVIGSPDLLSRHEDKDWIDIELEEYKNTHTRNNEMIVVIAFGDVVRNALESEVQEPHWIKNLNYLRGDRLRIYQSLEALDILPSEKVIEDIKRSLNGHRRDRSRLRKFQGLAAVFLIIAIIASYNWRNAEIGQIKALSESSKAKFALNRDSFDALHDALRAGRRLERFSWLLWGVWGDDEAKLKAEVMTALTESVFWVKEKNRLEDHSGWVNSVSFSPDGNIIASSNEDGIIKLWNSHGSNIVCWKAHKKGVMSVSFHPSGQILASSSLDGMVHLWKKPNNNKDVWSKDLLWENFFKPSFKPSKDESKEPFTVRVVNFSQDGKFIAVGSNDGTVKIYELDGVDGYKLSQKLEEKKDGEINSLSFIHDGQIIAIATNNGIIKLWDWQNKKVKLRDEQTFKRDSVRSVQFSPDGKYLLAGSKNKGTLILWEWDGIKLIWKKQLENSEGVETVNFSRDGKVLASAGQDNIVRLWNLDEILITKLIGHSNDGISITKLFGHSNYVKSVSFSPDQQTLASGSQDGTVKLWQFKTQLKVLSNDNNIINSVSCSPKCDVIAAASDKDNKVKFWRPGGTLIAGLKGHKDRINNISYSSDGQKVATASDDGTIMFWQLNEKGEPNCTKDEDDGKKCYEEFPEKENNKIIDVSFSPNNKTIAFTTNKDEVKLWQLKDPRQLLIKSPEVQDKIAYGVRFSPNGEILASTGENGIVKLWNTKYGSPINIKESEEPVAINDKLYEVEFNPDGNMIAGASYNGSVKLWKIKKIDETTVSLMPMAPLRKTDSDPPVTAVSFSPNKQMLASANDKGTIFIWKLDGTFITELNGHSKYVQSLTFSSDSTTLVSGSDDASIILWNLDNLSLEHFMTLGCSWMRDYLDTTDTPLCEGISVTVTP